MPFDFPNSPTLGQSVTASNGVVYTWDGVKWTVAGGGGIGGESDEIDLIKWGADPTGVADAAPLLNSALATGKSVYAPAGSYYLKSQVTFPGTVPQHIRGQGLGSVFLVNDQFSPSASAVFVLGGAEQNACTMQDLRIVFAQPSDIGSRSTFAPLGSGTSGTGGTGVRYCPAIGWGTSSGPVVNRFRLERIRIEAAWDGIHQLAGQTGGWWMQDIEMCAFHIGLKIGDTRDFTHIKGWHHWDFGLTSSQRNNVFYDGQMYAMQLGDGTSASGVHATNVDSFCGHVSINSTGMGSHFEGLRLDNGATLYHYAALWSHITNCYLTPAGSATVGPAIQMMGGRLFITNIAGWSSGTYPLIQQTGGNMRIGRGALWNSGAPAAVVSQTAGFLGLANIMWPLTTDNWTVAPIQSAGNLLFTGNTFTSVPAGNVGAVQCTADTNSNVIQGNNFGVWSFTAPGPLGLYWPNNTGATTGNTGRIAMGINTDLWAKYGTVAPYADVRLLHVGSADGSIHIGALGGSLVNEANVFINGGAYCEQTYTPVNMTNGGSTTVPDYCSLLMLGAAGTIGSYTVTMPANPVGNQILRIATSQAITSLTISPNTGQTVSAAPSTLPANSGCAYVYNGGTWHWLDIPSPAPATVVPVMDGTAAVGTATVYARQDHVHPSDTSRLAIAGGTLTGPVVIPAGTITGNMQIAAGGGQLTVGTNTGVANFVVNGPTLQYRGNYFQTAGLNRWLFGEDSTAEGGSNAGSNFSIVRFDDTGANIGTPVSIVRSTGVVTFASGATISAGGIDVTGVSTIRNAVTITAGGLTVTGASTFNNTITVNQTGTCTFGTASGVANIALNGGAGSTRQIVIGGGGTTQWAVGANLVADYTLNRYVSGTATDNPIKVLNSTGQVELGITAGADTIVGKQSAGAAADTGGFLLIPFLAGAPTGVPTNSAKGAAMRYDTTNHKLWVYDAGWKGVVLA